MQEFLAHPLSRGPLYINTGTLGFLDNSPSSSVENSSINNTGQIPHEMYDSREEEKRDGSEFDNRYPTFNP
jgi:hypothetical protein